MTELSNPLATFMEEVTDFGEGFEVGKDDLFACYKHWAIKKNYHPGTEMSFKRRFLAATQELLVKSYRRGEGEKTHNVYLGVKLRPKAQAYADGISNFEKEIF
jgi:hypothetical protein